MRPELAHQRTSGAAASSSGCRAKQPSGSGGDRVVLRQAGVDEAQPRLLHAEDLAGALHLSAPDLGDVLLDLGRPSSG